MALKTGSRLGPYEILDPLGSGGMGEVYRAKDTRLDRTVAVKVLPSHLSCDPILRQRFEREARSISQLNHPHICVLHDVGRDQEMDYLVMEHLEGESLAARLQSGALPVREALGVGAQIADALDRAHRNGVVHRDLKPGNIMLTRSGAKLLDFGLARSTGLPQPGPASGSPQPTSAATVLPPSPLTSEGAVVGTFQYMSPEQLEGREADHRSDIFAFGVVLYEMLTGRRAFDAKTRVSLVASILRDDPRPLAECVPEAPPALDRLLRACLAKNPDDRWQTMHDVMLQLRWMQEAASSPSTPIPAPAAAPRAAARPGRLPWLVAAGALLIAAVAAAAALRPAGSAEGTGLVRAAIPPPDGITFHLQSTQPGPLALSPDGRRVAFVGRDARGALRLYVRPLDSASAVALEGTDDASYPFWSADGRSLGYFARGQVWRIEPAGGPPTRVCEAPAGKGGSWNREGIILFAPSFNAPLYRVPAAGGTPEAVTRLDEGRRENSHRHPRFLPDGRHFLYVARVAGDTPGESSAILLGDLASGAPRLLTRATSQAMYAAGHLLYLRGATLTSQPFDLAGLQLQGDPASLIPERVRSIGGAVAGVFAASDNGVLVYQAAGEAPGMTVAWSGLDGSEISRIDDAGDLFDQIELSPDGRLASVVLTDNATGTPDVWVLDVARGSRTRLTLDPGADTGGIWSPDGRRLAYSASVTSAHFDLYAIDAGGREQPRPLLISEMTKFASDWSPDGREIAFTARTESGSADVWILSVSDGSARRFLDSRFLEDDLRWSPDGALASYLSDESGRNEVYVVPYPGAGSKWQVSTGGAVSARWSSDGRKLVWAAEGGTLFLADVTRERGVPVFGAPRRLFTRPDMVAFDLSPGGQQVLALINREFSVREPLSLVLDWPRLLPK